MNNSLNNNGASYRSQTAHNLSREDSFGDDSVVSWVRPHSERAVESQTLESQLSRMRFSAPQVPDLKESMDKEAWKSLPVTTIVKEFGYDNKIIETAIVNMLERGISLTDIKSTSLLDEIYRLEEASEQSVLPEGETDQNLERAVGWEADSVLQKTWSYKSPHESSHELRKNNKRLLEENAQLEEQKHKLEESSIQLKDRLTCVACKDNTISQLFLNCAHLVCCFDCGKMLKKCPVCIEKIISTVNDVQLVHNLDSEKNSRASSTTHTVEHSEATGYSSIREGAEGGGSAFSGRTLSVERAQPHASEGQPDGGTLSQSAQIRRRPEKPMEEEPWKKQPYRKKALEAGFTDSEIRGAVISLLHSNQATIDSITTDLLLDKVLQQKAEWINRLTEDIASRMVLSNQQIRDAVRKMLKDGTNLIDITMDSVEDIILSGAVSGIESNSMQQRLYKNRISEKLKSPQEEHDYLKSRNAQLKQKQHELEESNKKLNECLKCTSCKEKDVSLLFLPCKHLIFCNDCGGDIDTCPVCFQDKTIDEKKARVIGTIENIRLP